MTDAGFWDGIAEKYSRQAIGDEAAYEASLDRVRHWLRPEWDALELGCGTGNTAVKLASALRSYRGSDLSAQMIRIAERRAGDAGVQTLSFWQAGAHEAVADGRYDAILAFNLLHLVDERAALFQAVRARLPEGGLFISKTPCLWNKPWFKPLIAVMRWVGKAPGLVQFLDPAKLEAEIAAAGFEIVETGDYPKSPVSRFIVARAN